MSSISFSGLGSATSLQPPSAFASCPPSIKTDYIRAPERIAVSPFTVCRLTQLAQKLLEGEGQIPFFPKAIHGDSPFICRAEALPRLAIHLARRSRLASGRFAEARILDDWLNI
jgi:hypothetical protein